MSAFDPKRTLGALPGQGELPPNDLLRGELGYSRGEEGSLDERQGNECATWYFLKVAQEPRSKEC